MNEIDFASDPKWHHIFYSAPKSLKDLRKYLRDNPNQFVSLYHGTSAEFPIMIQGLRPTSHNRRNSFQSTSGYVCLSVYPGMAFEFGRLAYPHKTIVVYRATITIRRLLADLDQLRNQRLYAGKQIGNSLAESLAFGHGARIRGRIEPINLGVYSNGQCKS